MTDAPISIPCDDAGRPDLQQLIEKAGRRYAQSIGEDYDPRAPHQGGYQHITAAEWAAWDRVNAEWQAQRRSGLPGAAR